MPEAPDVEVYSRRLARLEGKRVEHVTVHQSRVHEDPRRLRRLQGRLGRPRRHGKWLVAPVGEAALALHFGMAGDLVLHEGDEPQGSRLDIAFQDGSHAAYVSRRQLGRTDVVADLEDLQRRRGLGPDVLSVDKGQFVELLRRRRGMVKSALLDQSLMAGLGNEYVDEALFQARIHPRTPLEALGEQDLRRLHTKVRHVLHTAMRHPRRGRGGVDVGSLPVSWLLPHRGGRCPRCGAQLTAVKAGGRRGWACERETPP